MPHVSVPDGDDLRLEHLVLDINGTLTDRGAVIDGAAAALEVLRADLETHLVSADTFGTAEALGRSPVAPFTRVNHGEETRRYIERLGPARCVAVGNGRNDVEMLRTAALGIAVVGPEGASAHAVAAADLLASSVTQALGLLAEPTMLTATLRPRARNPEQQDPERDVESEGSSRG